MGHSVGEYVAACTAGVFTLEDGLRLIAERGRLMQGLPSTGTMAAVFADEATVLKTIEPYPDQLSVAAVNGPSNVVISGAGQVLSDVLEVLSKKGIKSRRLNVSQAFHSPLMDFILDEYEGLASAIQYSEPQIGLMSNVTGNLVTLHQVTQAHYWREHIRKPVRFADTMRSLQQSGCNVFVEIGPNPTLLSMGKQCLEGNTYTWLPSLREGQGDWQIVLSSLAHLYIMGADIHWKNFDRDYPRQKLVLPTYPFQRERYWGTANSGEQKPEQNSMLPSEPSSTNRVEDLFYTIQWHAEPRPGITTVSGSEQSLGGRGGCLIFCDSNGLGKKLADSLRTHGRDCCLVSPADGYAEPDPNHRQINPNAPADFLRLSQEQTFTDVVYLWPLDQGLTKSIKIHELVDAQKRSTGGLLYLAQALIRQGKSGLANLWVITGNAQSVSAEEKTIEAGQATVLGLSRSLVLEHPELHCVCLDLDAQATGSEVDDLEWEILHNDGQEQEIAFRASRYVRRLVRSEVPSIAHPRFQNEGSYLITGGLGGLGLTIAEWMSQNGAKNLVLMGRNGASKEAQKILERMEKTGTRVLAVRGDISKAEDLSKILFEIGQAMPPLRGVIHAAGILDDGVFLQQNWKRFADVMRPKVQGAWNLHLQTRDLPLDFLVLFSSGAAVLGAAGQSNYAAANAFLDALAAYRQARGLPAISINWGAWAEVGMAATRGLDTGRGLDMLGPEIGLLALTMALESNMAQVSVLPADWHRILSAYAVNDEPRLLQEIARSVRSEDTQAAKPQADSFVQQLTATVPNKRKSLLSNHVRGKVAQVLSANNANAIDIHEPLQAMGLNSLMALELRNQLNRSTGRVLPATLLFEYPTIDELANYLFDQIVKPEQEVMSSVNTKTQQEDKTESPVPADTLDNLSTDELAALLMEKLSQIDTNPGP